MRVEEILDRNRNQVFAIRPDQPLREAAAMFAAKNIGAAPVTDSEGTLLGILSERDLVRALGEIGGGLLELEASDLMTRSVVTCTPETTIDDALSMMALHRIRHLPVLRGEKIVSVISVRDMLEFRMEAREERFAALIRAKRGSSRAIEVAELTNRAKAEFLTGISDQLKGPLGAIIGFAEVLSDEIYDRLAPPEFGQYAHEIEINGRRLLAMVDNLLELSRIQIGSITLIEETLSIPLLVSTCVHLVSETLERNGAIVQVDVDDALPEISADKRMVTQMLVHLLTNAVQFTPRGGTVTIGCTVGTDCGVRLSVRDTGTGIAPDNLAKVVEPFFQVETAVNRRHEGAGLGLTLVNSMIQAHQGLLDLESRIGIGTTATLRFPAERTVALAQRRLNSRAAAA